VLAPPREGSTPRVPSLGRLKLPAAAAVGVLLVAFAVWAIADGGDEPAAPDAAVQVTTALASPAPRTSPPQTSDSPSASEPVAPSPDPTREAFKKISAGDCLDAHYDESGDWNKSRPRAVGCGRSDAYLKVYKVADDTSGCRNGSPGDVSGELWWSHGEEGNEIVLCVRRQFRPGECLLATEGAKEDTVAVSNSDLMTVWPCGEAAPGGYDFVLRVTAFTSGACPSGGRRVSWDLGSRTLCTRIV